MHTGHTYDAKCASHHITQLAIPRVVGSAGETEVQDYIVEQFTELGLDVSWEPFTFTKFPAEVLPRILSALFVLIILSVPWFGERFPIPVCFACVLSLTIAMFFTQWQKRLEGLYDVGRKHRTENIIATNNANRDNNTPAFLLVAHYDSKSQTLPIAVRMVAYGVAIVGLIALTIVMLVKVIALIWLPNYIVWGIAGITSFCLLLLQINLTENRSPGAFDNASGVGVMLEVARVMTARDERKNVTFLATGAEEYGMCGALRYIQAHADTYNRENTYVINLDGLGIGKGVNLITRYGIPPTRTARTLGNLFRTSSEALGIRVSERYLPIGVGLDSIPIASRGFETVTLTASGVGSVALKIHSKQDQSELLNEESLQQVGELIVDVIECA